MLEAVSIRDPERVMRAYPHEMSGGMGQRIMIAMMLIPNPEILIADEPTSALDVSVQRQVLDIMDKLVKDRGMGLIFISHDLNLVADFCDRVLIMYAGRIVEICDADKLHQAKHPYTRGLLNSLPRLDAPRDRLEVLERDPAVGAGRQCQRAGVTMTMLQIKELNVWFGSGRDRVDAVRTPHSAWPRAKALALSGKADRANPRSCAPSPGLPPTGRAVCAWMVMTCPAKRHKAFFKTVQMVFQDPYASLHPRHSVDQVLGETLHLHGFADIDARVVKLLDDVGLGQKFRFRYPHQLSGGQRQRVAIARALGPGTRTAAAG